MRERGRRLKKEEEEKRKKNGEKIKRKETEK